MNPFPLTNLIFCIN